MEQEIQTSVRHVLIACARTGNTISYRDLVARADVPPPHGIHKTTLALENLVREDHAAGRPLLAAFAVSRANAGLPGQGFFHLLAELGRYNGPDRGPQAEEVFGRELKAALQYWGEALPDRDDQK
ncbi:hypothetical protein [Pelagibius sp. Alg239-R121]|uniref:hypothetical protein n=1 Tax=Pelagibius sp. Alg239-R121 TaxID=2993448 RepID=UPI0024A67CFF|nr:hypothetical protein [Pelagibius sp. Alg239-R121]